MGKPETMTATLTNQKWDIVISDYTMPHFSGIAALELLKQSGFDLPFIIVSGAIGEDVAVAVMKAGAHRHARHLWAKGEVEKVAALYLTLSPFASTVSGKNEMVLQSPPEVGL